MHGEAIVAVAEVRWAIMGEWDDDERRHDQLAQASREAEKQARTAAENQALRLIGAYFADMAVADPNWPMHREIYAAEIARRLQWETESIGVPLPPSPIESEATVMIAVHATAQLPLLAVALAVHRHLLAAWQTPRAVPAVRAIHSMLARLHKKSAPPTSTGATGATGR